MAELSKILPTLHIDITKFKKRVAALAPRIDEVVTSVQGKALDIEDLIADGKVEDEILPHVKEGIALQDIETQYIYARHQDAVSRLLEAAAHLREIELTMQSLEARQISFGRLINREQDKPDENL